MVEPAGAAGRGWLSRLPRLFQLLDKGDPFILNLNYDTYKNRPRQRSLCLCLVPTLSFSGLINSRGQMLVSCQVLFHLPFVILECQILTGEFLIYLVPSCV